MQQKQPLCGYKESDEEVSLRYFITPIQEDNHKTIVENGTKCQDLSYKDVPGDSGAFLYVPQSTYSLSRIDLLPDQQSACWDLDFYNFLMSPSVDAKFLCALQKYLLEDHYDNRGYRNGKHIRRKRNKFRCIFSSQLGVDLCDSLKISKFDMEQETPTSIVVYAIKLVESKLYIAPIVIPVTDDVTTDFSCKVKIKRWYQTIDDPNDPEIGKTLHIATPQDAAEFDRENRPVLKPIVKTKVETVQKPQDAHDPEVPPEISTEVIEDAKSHESTETIQEPQDTSDHEVPSEVLQPKVSEETEAIEKSQTDLMQNQNSDSSVNKPEFDKVETKSKIISFVLFLLIAAGVTSLAILKSINLCKIIIPCIGLAAIALCLSLIFCFAENIFNSCVNNEYQKKLHNSEYQIKTPSFARLFVSNEIFEKLAMPPYEPQSIEHQKN
jgi:hypothetical protein